MPDSTFSRSARPWQAWLGGLLAVLLALNLLAFGSPARMVRAADGWHDTGLVLPEGVGFSDRCFDANQPNTLLIAVRKATSDTAVGSYAYNLATGQRKLLNPRPFDYCSQANGFMYAKDPGENLTTYTRFNTREAKEEDVACAHTNSATDSTAWSYEVKYDQTFKRNVLQVSQDGCFSYYLRGTDFVGLTDVAVSPADGRSVYVLTTDPGPNDVKYSIYFSSNGGDTWEKRFEDRTISYNLRDFDFLLYTLPGTATPVNSVVLGITRGSRGGLGEVLYVSGDGARSFRQVGSASIITNLSLFYTPDGLMRYTEDDTGFNLQLSTDGGKSWQNRPLPFKPTSDQISASIDATVRVVPNAPSNLLMYLYKYGVASDLEKGTGDVWYSPDSGKSWRKLGLGRAEFMVGTSAPFTLVGIEDHHLYTLDLPEADKTDTLPVGNRGVAEGTYFPLTGHNLTGSFKRYWEQNGGLAQFGYPKTEAFREFNPADGHVYVVQYFERNRLEYHPENVSTEYGQEDDRRYEVLLGLLGNQLTEGRRAEAPFKPTTNNGQGAFFPETGHNLSGSFHTYWEQHGGLSLYGYPISETFEEVNPDDGQTYLVQYFQRNRFEYHPANKGTPYEVLLGLLGNTLLKQKGWM